MPTPKPKKVGRPKLPKGHAKGRVLAMRLTNEEIKSFTAAAKEKKQTVSSWMREAAVSFNNGKPYHGSGHVMDGKLCGRTGMTDYFFFLCPKCANGQAMRVLEYEHRDNAIQTKREGEKKTPKTLFTLAFHLYCPVCQLEDFTKINNSHQAAIL